MKLLNEIQQKLDVPKSQRNDFGGYNYRSCEDILTAVKPLLGEATLKIDDELVLIGTRYYVRATATLFDGKDKESCAGYAREEETKKGMDAAQITGAASSYARKYALNGLFAIDDTKDPDATNTHEKQANNGTTSDMPSCPVCGKPGREDKKKANSFYCWVKKDGCGHIWEQGPTDVPFDSNLTLFEWEKKLEEESGDILTLTGNWNKYQSRIKADLSNEDQGELIKFCADIKAGFE